MNVSTGWSLMLRSVHGTRLEAWAALHGSKPPLESGVAPLREEARMRR